MALLAKQLEVARIQEQLEVATMGLDVVDNLDFAVLKEVLAESADVVSCPVLGS